MTDKPTPEDDMLRDEPMMAAEHALGLLEGDELLTARGKLATDPEYAERKAWWDNWFAPWTDEVSGMEPSADLWSRIEGEVNASRASQAQAELSGGGGAAANVIDLQSRLRRWQFAAGLTSVAAAALAAVMVLSPDNDPTPTPGATDAPMVAAANPLVAQVPIGDTGLRLDVTYLPESEQMLVGAIGLTADGVHDHELWLVPADGSELQSLGVVAPGEVRRMELPTEITRNLGDGVGLVLTREPIGGKPEGQDAGPVVAEGAFSTV